MTAGPRFSRRTRAKSWHSSPPSGLARAAARGYARRHERSIARVRVFAVSSAVPAIPKFISRIHIASSRRRNLFVVEQPRPNPHLVIQDRIP